MLVTQSQCDPISRKIALDPPVPRFPSFVDLVDVKVV